jgi:hypothetical protein
MPGNSAHARGVVHHGATGATGLGGRSRVIAKRKPKRGDEEHREEQPEGDESAQLHGLFIHREVNRGM